jgi:hypothetical protein
MDPYLEHPAFFPGLHDSLITYLREALQAALPEPYYADSRTRVWIETSGRAVEPDVDLIRSPGPSRGTNGGAVAVACPPVAIPVAGEEVSESFLEIHTTQDNHPLITAIEVLSPTNKTPGAHGRTQYVQKQEELLKSRVNLLEIDLLRAGQHTTAVTYNDAVAKAGPFDYHVCVRKMDELQYFFVYPIRLPERLPELLIPLLPGDRDVKIDLQLVFDRCYDTGPYRRSNPYRRPPEPPLSPEQAAWAAQLLREKGLFPPA